jgi:hypothetical protein
MVEKIELRYINDRLQIGMVDIKRVYQLSPAFIQLMPEVYRGKLVYRAKGSSKRTSYDQIKMGLVKQKRVFTQIVPNWL